MKKTFELACSALCFFALSALVEQRAEAAYWHSNGSGCTWRIDGHSVPNPVSPGLGAVQVESGIIGDLQVVCPITAVNLDGVSPHLGLYAYDDNASNSVTVTVKRVAKTAMATVSTICSLSSDNSGSQFKSAAPSGSCFATALDTDGFIYFAVIDVHRSNANFNAIFTAIELY
jgi:hypothetical protein